MIDLFGLNLHLYGLILGGAVVLALEISQRAAKKSGIDTKIVERMFIWTIVFGVIGARAYHVMDLWKKYYSINQLNILYIWEGGLGIWGAICGGVMGLWIAWKVERIKIDFLKILDIGIIGLPLAQAVGRLGNAVNGELYGKYKEPLFAYEGAMNAILFVILWKIGQNKKSGFLTGIYLVGYGIIRISLENFREPSVIWRIGGIPTAIIFGFLAIISGSLLIWRRQS